MHLMQKAAAIAVILASVGQVWTSDAIAATGGQTFVLRIPGSADGDTFARKRAAPGAQCGGGQDVSPPLSWQGAPAGTKSFAVMMTDPDGRNGLGVVHWVHYGLPPTLDALAEGAGTAPSTPGVGGTNSPGKTVYHGACPPAGEVAHHYLIQIFALDLPPDALPAGLTRDALFQAIGGHVLAATSTVRRYGV